MNENKILISFIIHAEKGFFKKPDINDTIYLTYNMIHKPAVLGILGAIIGLDGFTKANQLPEYYQRLKSIPIGIKPVNSRNGTFQKIVITYNNTTGFASEEKGGNLIINEQTLLNPSYKIYLLLELKNEDQKKLYNNIKNQKSEYLPYMGKNDFSLWWYKDEVKEYEYDKLERETDFYIDTLFMKKEPVMNSVVEAVGISELADQQSWFFIFERLPYKYNEELFQYDITDFVYTNAKFKKDVNINSGNLYKIKNQEKVVFLF